MIFILGIARTGSKIYMNFLNVNKDINISEELHYKDPWFVRKDTCKTLKSKVPETQINEQTKELVDILFSLERTGFVVTAYKNKEKFISFIQEKKPSNYIKLFKVLLEADAFFNNKKIPGAKFPVNIMNSDWIIKNFNDSYIINITRDPRAIFYSMYNKDINIDNKKGHKFIIRLKRLVYIILQYKSQYKFHNKQKENKNYFFSRYEDLILTPEEQIKKICDFLNIDFEKEMLSPPINGSSFVKSKGKGIHDSSIERWKIKLNKFDKFIIELFLRRIIKEYGYDI